MTPADAAFHRYRDERSDAAFREVVAAFLPMVYGTALRLGGGDSAEAEDVCQMVFADLARKAPALREDASVGAWLHRHTCFLMKNTIRSHVRRRAREHAAIQLHTTTPVAAADHWASMESRLDQCLESLRDSDRRILILRFFEGRALQDVGKALGIGDDAAQKRVSRALERLRALLTDSRTAGVSVAILTTLLGGLIRAEVPAEVAATMAGKALKLAGVRQGPLTPATGWPALRIAAWAAACFGVALTVRFAWPETRAASDGRGRHGAESVSPIRPPSPARNAGLLRETARESVDSLLARLRVLVREPGTSTNARSIAALIDAVPYEHMPAFTRAIEDTGVTSILFRSLPSLLRRWGDHDVAAAMSWYVCHITEEGIPFVMSNPAKRALGEWQPANPAALREWYASAMTHGGAALQGLHGDVVRQLGRLIAAKDPETVEEFLSAFPDRPIFEGSKASLHEDIRTSLTITDQRRGEPALAEFSFAADVPGSGAAVPTPAEYPALHTALNLPAEEAAEVVAENLQAWSRVAGAAPVEWAFAHLSRESARRMLGEVIPVWAQHDPAGLRAWIANGPPPEWQPADGTHCLTESVISALAASDPVAATDFLVNHCKSTSVKIGDGLWANMSEFSRDIAAGITSAGQCREVLDLLSQWNSVRDEQITLLENAALARWKRWDPATARAWESARNSP